MEHAHFEHPGPMVSLTELRNCQMSHTLLLSFSGIAFSAHRTTLFSLTCAPAAHWNGG